MPEQALLVVNVQNCFLPGGSLSVTGGDEIVPVVNRYIELFRQAGLSVYASRDWHPDVPKQYGGKWPIQGVQVTQEAEFTADLKLPEDVEIITNGVNINMDGYSSFEGVNSQHVSFEQSLRERGVVHLFVGGIATDYFVKATVLDALQKGFRVTLLMDAAKGVDVEPGDSDRATEAMIRAGVRVANLKDVEEDLRVLAG